VIGKSYDLDLNKLRDEELVVLAQECGYRPAEAELLLRHRDLSNAVVEQFARRRGLADADVDDARQDAVFGVLKAIARYDTRLLGKAQRCPFRAFLRRVLIDRVKDFVKLLWRYNVRYGRRADAEGWPHAGRDSDPVRAAASNELMGRFREAVAQLDATQRRLVDGLIAGRRLRAIAGYLQISYDAAKRRRRRLRQELASRLCGSAEGQPASWIA
jgi:RNA polymerase sigma factor (sigma-70 family)